MGGVAGLHLYCRAPAPGAETAGRSWVLRVQVGAKRRDNGFRSTFRTWAQECTRVADEVAELALAHVGTDATRAVYARGELLEKRRKLMSDWQRYCERHR